MAKLDELIPLYLKACAVEGKTDRTLQAYDETMRRLRSACSVLAIPEEIEAFRAAHVYLFMSWIKDRGVSSSTQHLHQRQAKAFFSWCKRMEYVTENPFMRVPMVRRELKVVQPFLKDDITRLIDAANPSTYVGARMRAMIFFLLDTGVRSSELVSIELEDVYINRPGASHAGQRPKTALDRNKRAGAGSAAVVSRRLQGKGRRLLVPDRRWTPAAASPYERHVQPSCPEGRRKAGQPAPVQAYVCDLGRFAQTPANSTSSTCSAIRAR